jgi:hypothetical protein
MPRMEFANDWDRQSVAESLDSELFDLEMKIERLQAIHDALMELRDKRVKQSKEMDADVF